MNQFKSFYNDLDAADETRIKIIKNTQHIHKSREVWMKKENLTSKHLIQIQSRM